MIRITEDAILNGATPMFLRRSSVEGRVVGVQGGHHQVAGLRGLDGDLGGLDVADRPP